MLNVVADGSFDYEKVLENVRTGRKVRNVITEMYGETLVSWAATYGHEAVAKLLPTKEFVDPNSKDSGGKMPLSLLANSKEEGHCSSEIAEIADQLISITDTLAHPSPTHHHCTLWRFVQVGDVYEQIWYRNRGDMEFVVIEVADVFPPSLALLERKRKF